ncbi:hypothetical protein V7008_23625 [Neobacillus drentensis]
MIPTIIPCTNVAFASAAGWIVIGMLVGPFLLNKFFFLKGKNLVHLITSTKKYYSFIICYRNRNSFY